MQTEEEIIMLSLKRSAREKAYIFGFVTFCASMVFLTMFFYGLGGARNSFLDAMFSWASFLIPISAVFSLVVMLLVYRSIATIKIKEAGSWKKNIFWLVAILALGYIMLSSFGQQLLIFF